MFLAGLTV